MKKILIIIALLLCAAALFFVFRHQSLQSKKELQPYGYHFGEYGEYGEYDEYGHEVFGEYH